MEEADFKIADLVSVTVYVSDLNDALKTNDVYKEKSLEREAGTRHRSSGAASGTFYFLTFLHSMAYACVCVTSPKKRSRLPFQNLSMRSSE